MTPYKRNGIYTLWIPKQFGGTVERSTGTSDKDVYKGMKRMVAGLKAARRWALLTALVEKQPGTRIPRLTLGRLYDAHTANALDALEASLSAQALAPHISAYLTSCKGRGLAVRNLENLKRQLASFTAFVPGASTADLTAAKVTAWLASLGTSPGTRRQYLFAVTGFTRYLVYEVEVLNDYPLGKVKAPKKNAARMVYMDAATDEKIVQAASTQYRSLFAFIKGTGCDVTPAINTAFQNIDWRKGTARLRGTKTAKRDVHQALIEPWALPYVRDVVGFYLNGPGWSHLTRSGAYHHHKRCCEAVGVEDYTLKDSRHSVGVRMAKAGYTIHEIAEQLGNSAEVCARVYTQFIPKLEHKQAVRS